MNINKDFEDKWGDIVKRETDGEEMSIFVEPGEIPQTFRQFDLFCYFEFIKEILKDKNYKNSLEVGCGRGTISLYLKKYLGYDVSLSDISEDAIKLAKYNFSKHNTDGNIIVANSENLQYEDASFDLVVSIGLAEHFKDYTKLFAEQYRVVRSGGIMISLNIPKKLCIQNLNFINKFIRRVFLGDKRVKKDYYRNSDTPEMYKKVAEAVGFRNVYTVDVNPFPLFTPFSKNIESKIVKMYNKIYNKRKQKNKYPFKTPHFIASNHFLVGEK